MSELREKLEEAFDGDSTDEVSESTATPEESVVEETSVEASGEESTDDGGADEATPGGAEESGGESTTDEVAASTEEKPEEATESEKAEEQTADGLKAPYGWKPALREKFWDGLPDEVKAEVIRREVDIAKGMEQASNARKLEAEFNARVAPYAAEIASRGVQPMDAFDNYLKTAHNLRHANAPEKAALVAGIIQQYGVDIGQLDTVLTRQIEGAPVGGVDSGFTAALQQAMAPVNQFMSQYQQQQVSQAETQQQDIQTEIKTFQENPANEFYMDVKSDMANLLEAAAMRNQNMSLQDAYDRAILLHSDIAEIVSQRKLQSEATARDVAAKAAKAKSVGVESTSPDTVTGRTNSQAASLRGALEAAFNADAMD